MIFPVTTLAAFDSGFILSDAVMTNYRSMNKADIQYFLESNGSVLATQYARDDDGRSRTAADMIYQACQDYLINPQVILTKIQQESSLIRNGTATQRQLDRILGYGIPDSGIANPVYAGFFNQVDGATWQFNRYMRDPKSYDKQVGLNTIDGQTIRIENRATAALYTYTPHLAGGQSFYNLWNQWFARLLLSGTLAQDDTGTYWLITGGEKRLIANETVLNLNFDTRKKISVSKSELSAYRTGRKITLPHNFFFVAPWGTVYYIDVDENGDSVRRGVASQQVLRDLGVSPELIFPATSGDLTNIPETDPITPSDYENRDKLLQAPSGGVIYLGRDGKGHALYGPSVLQTNFPGWHLERSTQRRIDDLKRGDPVQFPEGTLITDQKTAGAVYVIVRNEDTNILEKRPFINASVFTQMGYSWDNILKVTKRELDLHPGGKSIKTATLQ